MMLPAPRRLSALPAAVFVCGVKEGTGSWEWEFNRELTQMIANAVVHAAEITHRSGTE
jgi:hypothetical protein